MSQVASTTHVYYAGFWRRLLAFFLDIALYTILTAPFMYLLIGHEYFFWLAGNEAYLSDSSALLFDLYTLLFFVAIFILWNVMSSTPGKLLMGCRIVDAGTLRPITPRQALIRLLGYIVSALPLYLGFVWAAKDKRKQALHDKLAGTLVIYNADDYACQSLTTLQKPFLKNGNAA